MSDEIFKAAHYQNLRRLRVWYVSYLFLFVLIICMVATGFLTGTMSTIVIISWVISYIGALGYSYKIQLALNNEGLYKSGAWQVLVGGILLGPILGGLFVPASVWRMAHRIPELKEGC